MYHTAPISRAWNALDSRSCWLAVFVDTDKRLKTKDENGVISVITPDGLQARNIITNSGMNIQQRVVVDFA